MALRELCTRHGAVLIFDEVMTGFRVGPQGAQGLYGIRPDLTTLGKVIGGGMPLGAFGGRRDIMQCIAPLGPVYQAGTLSGNPVAVAAGLATLKLVQAPGFFERLGRGTRESLVDGLSRAARAARRAFLGASRSAGCSESTSAAQPPQSYAEVMALRPGGVQSLLPRDAARKASTSRRRPSRLASCRPRTLERDIEQTVGAAQARIRADRAIAR